MPQIFVAVRCAACETFQVTQQKQIRKWSCVLCGEKQSLVRAYFAGAAKDARAVVQELNAARGHVAQAGEAQLSWQSNTTAFHSGDWDHPGTGEDEDWLYDYANMLMFMLMLIMSRPSVLSWRSTNSCFSFEITDSHQAGEGRDSHR